MSHLKTRLQRHMQVLCGDIGERHLGSPGEARAAEYIAGEFAALGYQVVRDRSDWILESATEVLQHQLIDGWAEAATAISPADANMIADWHSRRIAHVVLQRSRLVVGHEDLGAFIA